MLQSPLTKTQRCSVLSLESSGRTFQVRPFKTSVRARADGALPRDVPLLLLTGANAAVVYSQLVGPIIWRSSCCVETTESAGSRKVEAA